MWLTFLPQMVRRIWREGTSSKAFQVSKGICKNLCRLEGIPGVEASKASQASKGVPCSIEDSPGVSGISGVSGVQSHIGRLCIRIYAGR